MAKPVNGLITRSFQDFFKIIQYRLKSTKFTGPMKKLYSLFIQSNNQKTNCRPAFFHL